MKATKKDLQIINEKLGTEKENWSKFNDNYTFEEELKRTIHKADDVIDVVCEMKRKYNSACDFWVLQGKRRDFVKNAMNIHKTYSFSNLEKFLRRIQVDLI